MLHAYVDVATLRYACTRIQSGRSVDDSSIESAKNAGLICKLFYSDENVEAGSTLFSPTELRRFESIPLFVVDISNIHVTNDLILRIIAV